MLTIALFAAAPISLVILPCLAANLILDIRSGRHSTTTSTRSLAGAVA